MMQVGMLLSCSCRTGVQIYVNAYWKLKGLNFLNKKMDYSLLTDLFFGWNFLWFLWSLNPICEYSDFLISLIKIIKKYEFIKK